MKQLIYSPDSETELKGGSANPSGPQQPIGYEITINGKKITMLERYVTGEEILLKSNHSPVSCYTLYQKLEGCEFEKVSFSEKIDLKNPGLERFVTKDSEVFPYTVNQDPELAQEKELSPRTILQRAALDPEKTYLVEVEKDGTEVELAFKMDDLLSMNCRGIHFITKSWIESVDIEEYGKRCEAVPPARSYLIKVDKQKFAWPSPIISVEQVIRFVQNTQPSNYNLIKFMGSSPKPIPLPYTEMIDLREKCLLRFVVQPKTQNDGLKSGFSLPEEDQEFLNASGFQWEAFAENQYMWVIIHDYLLPEGYQTNTCSVSLMIPPSYPATEIDMAYFYPHLKKTSGKGINATSSQVIGGKSYQRWSRHRMAGDWKPGIDNIATHLLLVDNWLQNDLKR